jgi:peptidoglycan/LPS O-acetylase OafA/YrhL
VKWFGNQLLRLVLLFIAVVLVFYAVLDSGLIPMSREAWTFCHTLRFHYMAIGSFFGWILSRVIEQYRRSFFASYGFQALALVSLGYYFFVGINAGRLSIVLDVVLGVLYGTLILNVAVAPKRLIRLEWEPLVYLGKISYGIYMYHMTADYALRIAFRALGLTGYISVTMSIVYAGLLLSVTFVMAHLSFKYFESFFIRAVADRNYTSADGEGYPRRHTLQSVGGSTASPSPPKAS